MLVEESVWIKKSIEEHFTSVNFPLLNIGSSTGHFRTEVQPHIYKNIFSPIDEKNRVYHLDMKMDDGVDLVGDLSDKVFRNSIKNNKIRSVLCSNLLEHLQDPNSICLSITELLEKDDLIIVTVPYSYPYHKDPIDTYLRPNVDELHNFFPKTEIVSSKIVESKDSFGSDLMKNKRYFIIMLLRLLLPIYKVKEWKYILKAFINSNKKYSATCLLLRLK